MVGCSLIHPKQCLKHFHSEEAKRTGTGTFWRGRQLGVLRNPVAFFPEFFPLPESTNSEIQVSQKLNHLRILVNSLDLDPMDIYDVFL